MEREHLGDARAALPRYVAVLQARPAGPLSEQALVGMARAHAELAERAQQAAAWRALLKAHLGSWFTSEAQGRLRALGTRGGATAQ